MKNEKSFDFVRENVNTFPTIIVIDPYEENRVIFTSWVSAQVLLNFFQTKVITQQELFDVLLDDNILRTSSLQAWGELINYTPKELNHHLRKIYWSLMRKKYIVLERRTRMLGHAESDGNKLEIN